MGEARSSGARQAGLLVNELLAREPYRAEWNIPDYIQRGRQGRVHRRAVACVLSNHLWTHPRRSGEDASPDGLLPMVSKALSGTELSRQNLQLIVEAFAMVEDDVDRLWRLYDETDKVRLLTGPSSVPPEVAAAIGKPKHRMVSVGEHHYLGSDGLPHRHRTQLVLEAIEDGLDRYPCRFDTDALTVEVEEGGRLIGPLYDVHGNLHAVDILLDQPLRRGEETSLTYLMHFHYQEAPRPECRRAAMRRMENVGIRVEFHPEKLPRQVWWAVWDGLDGEIADREAVPLRVGNYVYRRMDYIKDTVVGFCWDW